MSSEPAEPSTGNHVVRDGNDWPFLKMTEGDRGMPVLTVVQWVLYLLLSVSLVMLFALSCNLLGLSIAFLRSRRAPLRHEPAMEVSEYPRVLVQLPAFNEGML